VHRSQGWTAQTIGEHAIAALRSSYVPVQHLAQVYDWDPV
jgi:hypothetical protein